jgi:Dyp-type peroxidase family
MKGVQGNVLKAYGTKFRFAWYGLLRVNEARPAREVLDRWREQVTFGSAEPRLEGSHLNLAFTHAGLNALGTPSEWLAPLPEDFTAGAVARSHDRAESAAEHWEYGREPAHLLAMVNAPSAEARTSAVERLERELGDAMAIEHRQPAGLLDHPAPSAPGFDGAVTCADRFSREHFGFADGCSQPSIEGRGHDDTGNGVRATRFASGLRELLETWGWLKPARYWRGVAQGEFLLGYANEDGEPAPGSDSPLCEHGTFMVYRKLQQDVRAFREHTEAWAARQGIAADRVQARIVGRWQDGTPLALSHEGPEPSIALDRLRANAFDYAEDPNGELCPLGAHIRRTNPRDDLPAGGEATMRHRMIRRGMPYGPAYDDDPAETDRGLVFICYGSSISRGFETVQHQWCDSGHALGLGAQPDYLLQQRPAPGAPLVGSLEIDGPDRILPPPERPFVTVRGMEYLLLPGRGALERLVAGKA